MSRVINPRRLPDLDKHEHALVRRAVKGDHRAYLELFLEHLPTLDQFVRKEVRHVQAIGGVGRGLIEPCAIVDQVYLAALHNLANKRPDITFFDWLRYLALHILRQQIRSELKEDASGIPLEQGLVPTGDVDTEFWEYYQPDEALAVEDVIGDLAQDPELRVEQRELADEIARQVEALPPGQGELLRMRLYDGLHADEIARLKDMSLEAVRQTLREACQAVRQNLAVT